jgi:hypothetical protein
MYNPPSDESSDVDTEYSLGNVQENGIEDDELMTEAEFKNISADDLSGQTYIVAVANADQYMGIDRSATGLVRKTKLSTLLESVEDWAQFKKITVMRNSTTDVTLTSNTLLMSGYFSPKTLSSTNSSTKHTTDDHAVYAVTDETIPTVAIYSRPASYELEGAIYLRRVIAYNKFNIFAGDNVNLTVKTWKVNNIPYCSNLLEQDGNACTEISNGVNNGLESHLFSIATKENADGSTTSGHSFEFYQMENKHTAVDYEAATDGSGDYAGIKPSSNTDPVKKSAEMYASREREYKKAKADNTDVEENTGIYKSLVKMTEYSSEALASTYKNNTATYVVLTAELDYWYSSDEKATEATPVDYDTASDEVKAKLIHRKADVTYTIHLGYCEDKGDDGYPTQKTAMDFNCRRNTKYTYNITINGVNQIVVEAEKEGETQPGAEGTVIDMSTSAYDLDAHYCVFNIELTNKQRAALQWYLTVPYGGYTYVYDSQENGLKQFDTESSGYTWIKFRPTSSMDVLAKYKDKTVTPQLDDTNIRSLDDLKLVEDGVMKYPWTDGTTTDDDPTSTTPHPYTVFIDEYVYHSDPKEPTISDEGGNEWLWGKYVNQENRKVDLYDESMYPSKDQESYYIPAIYTFSQRSIQSYYQEDADNTLAGFGLEHINENYGLNFYREDQFMGESGRNGRYNSIDKFGKDWTWDCFVNMTEPAVVPAGKNEDFNYLSVDETAYPVPMLHSRASGSSEFYLNSSSTKKYSSGPGCMNRNRDEDGDGNITADEIKWYVPSSQEYMQIAIGQTELPSPLIQFGEHDRKEFKLITWSEYKNTGDKLSDKRTQLQYHFWCSDNRYFFADEGMSIGDVQFQFNYWTAHTICYQVRCMRILGKNPNLDKESYKAVTDKDEYDFDNAFSLDDSSGHIYITSKYFTNTSIRPSTSTFLAPHDIASNTSMPPYKFEVAQDICYNITADDKNMSVDSNGYLSFNNGSSQEQPNEVRWRDSCAKNSICSKYTQEADGSDKGTWRVPNIRELSMMNDAGLTGGTEIDAQNHASNKSGGFYLSCTYEYFENPNWSSGWMYRFFGKRGDEGNLIARNMITGAQEGPSGAIHLRCVRDVISESDNDVDLGDK